MNISMTVGPWAVVAPVAVLGLIALAAVAARVPRPTAGQFLIYLIALGYGLALLRVTLLPVEIRTGTWEAPSAWDADLNLVPLLIGDIGRFAAGIALFVPFGLLLPLLITFADTVAAVVLRAATTAVAIEGLQLLFGRLLGDRRPVDVNDVLAGTAGAVLGLFLLRYLLSLPAVRSGADRLRVWGLDLEATGERPVPGR